MPCTYITSGPWTGYCEEDLAGNPDWAQREMSRQQAANAGAGWNDVQPPPPGGYPPPPPTFPGSGPGSATINPPSSGQYWDPTAGSNPLTSPGSPPANPPSGWGPIASTACDLIPNAAARLACQAVVQAATGGRQSSTPLANPGTGACPKGYHNGANGGCVIDGMGSYLPGDVGRPDYVWTPVNGRYGAGVTPIAVQAQRRACPAGYVVGKDGVCYDHIARTNRAWNPGHKPFLSGGDMHALSRAHQLKKQINKMHTRFGTKRPSSGPPTRRKK